MTTADITPFANGEFALDVIPSGDSFKVVGSGLAKALAFGDAYDLTRNIPDDEKGSDLVRTPGGEQLAIVVTEAGFYRAIGQRQTGRITDPTVRASVQRFQSWVFGEVLPALRRGTTPARLGDDPLAELEYANERLTQAIAIARSERSGREVAEARVLELEPRAAQADQYRAADGETAVGDFANDIKAWAAREHQLVVRHKDVWDFLGELGLLIRGRTIRHNEPTAFAIEHDYVRAKRTTFATATRGDVTSVSPRLTQAGCGFAWDRAVRRIAEYGSLRIDGGEHGLRVVS